jgi:hypothetical protein
MRTVGIARVVNWLESGSSIIYWIRRHYSLPTEPNIIPSINNETGFLLHGRCNMLTKKDPPEIQGVSTTKKQTLSVNSRA